MGPSQIPTVQSISPTSQIPPVQSISTTSHEVIQVANLEEGQGVVTSPIDIKLFNVIIQQTFKTTFKGYNVYNTTVKGSTTKKCHR